MRILVIKATGRIHEMQSDPRPGTLLENAKAAGLDPADIEEREVSRDEYDAMMAAQEAPRIKRQKVMAELEANDLKVIRALTEKDEARINEHLVLQGLLREQLRN